MSDQTTPSSELRQRLIEDLHKTGFPLELRTAQTLLTRGYHVDHNVYYIDKDEQKGREIEISALRNANSCPRDKPPRWLRHRLLIECKKAQSDKPWVIMSSPVTGFEQYSKTILQKGLQADEIQDPNRLASIAPSHPFWLLPRRGRSYHEAFKGPDKTGAPDVIFKAIML